MIVNSSHSCCNPKFRLSLLCCQLQCTELDSWRGIAVGRVKKPLTVILETLILMLVRNPYMEWHSIVQTSEQENVLSRLKTGKCWKI
jgi:hypothetical protein